MLEEVSPETLVNVAEATVAVTFVSVDVLNVDVGIHKCMPPSAKIPLVGQYKAFAEGTWLSRASTPANLTVTVVPDWEQVIVPELAARLLAVEVPAENKGIVEKLELFE